MQVWRCQHMACPGLHRPGVVAIESVAMLAAIAEFNVEIISPHGALTEINAVRCRGNGLEAGIEPRGNLRISVVENEVDLLLELTVEFSRIQLQSQNRWIYDLSRG